MRIKILTASFLCVFLSGCAWSYRYELDDGPAAREFAKRCHGIDIDWSEAEAGMMRAESHGEISRREAAAHVKLVEKIKAGSTPTDAEYDAAGCR